MAPRQHPFTHCACVCACMSIDVGDAGRCVQYTSNSHHVLENRPWPQPRSQPRMLLSYCVHIARLRASRRRLRRSARPYTPDTAHPFLGREAPQAFRLDDVHTWIGGTAWRAVFACHALQKTQLNNPIRPYASSIHEHNQPRTRLRETLRPHGKNRTEVISNYVIHTAQKL